MEEVKYYLLLTANPLSDSLAAETIFRTINRLDILSRDITIFMPGFDTQMHSLEELNNYNNLYHEDYHGQNPIYHTHIESCGDIYFNDTDFAKFMLDLENQSSKFEYLGRTELVFIPTVNGNLLFDNIFSINLEPFVYSANHNKTIEEFLLTIIKLLLKDKNRNSLSLKGTIEEYYNNCIGYREQNETSSITIQLDKTILQYMKWNDNEDIWFISYSTKDEYDAFALKLLLEKRGKHVWIAPDGIPTGFDYAKVIPAALRITTHFLVLLSHNSANSDWVRREIDRPINERKKIDGIFLDNFNLNDVIRYDDLAFLLSNTQLKYSIAGLFEQGEELNELLNS